MGGKEQKRGRRDSLSPKGGKIFIGRGKKQTGGNPRHMGSDGHPGNVKARLLEIRKRGKGGYALKVKKKGL